MPSGFESGLALCSALSKSYYSYESNASFESHSIHYFTAYRTSQIEINKETMNEVACPHRARPGRDSAEVTRSRPGRVRVSLPNSRLKARRPGRVR